MKKIVFNLILLFNIAIVDYSYAQEKKFSVQVNTDSVGVGQTFVITYTAENINGSFLPPSFEEFEVVAGPMSSTSFSMINGETKSMMTYKYYLIGRTKGHFIIPPASIKGKGESLNSKEIQITVVNETPKMKNNNLDNDFDAFETMPEMKTLKKKRKITTL